MHGRGDPVAEWRQGLRVIGTQSIPVWLRPTIAAHRPFEDLVAAADNAELANGLEALRVRWRQRHAIRGWRDAHRQQLHEVGVAPVDEASDADGLDDTIGHT